MKSGSNQFSKNILIITIMKRVILFLTGILLLQLSLVAAVNSGNNEEKAANDNTIRVIVSPEMRELAGSWAHDFTRMQGGADVEILPVENGDFQIITDKSADFAIIPGKVPEGLGNEWVMAIARSIVVPVINRGNPFLDKIYGKGITRMELAGLLTGNKPGWGQLIPGESKPAHVYVISDQSAMNSLAQYTGVAASSFRNENSAGADDVIAAVAKDPLAIGFCRLSDLKGSALAGQVTFMPIDRNENGKLDYIEMIYHDAGSFERGVWIGKYPGELYSEVYLVALKPAGGAISSAFARYLVTSGQDVAEKAGFSGLVAGERLAKAERLINRQSPDDPSGNIFHSNVALIVILSFLFVALLVSALLFFAKKGGVQPSPEKIARGQLNPESIGIPQGLLFSKSHTWSFMDRDGKVKIGIDDFMQHIVGPVTRVEMKKAGEKIRKGDILVKLVQNGKQLHLYSPVSGTIAEFNPLLKSDPSQLNASPYTSGWLYRVEPANWMKELQFMEMADSYRKWISDEFSRLRDFLATSIKVSRPELQYVVLQDGGHLKDHVLADFGPEVWEDFQTSFLDKAR